MALQLKDTAEMMNSEDYKERFKAEYHQVKIRKEKLRNFIAKIEGARKACSNMLEPKHDCSLGLLQDQYEKMDEYFYILQQRAVIEGIDVEE